MMDREKVIKGLECCLPMTTRNGLADCKQCPYDRKITLEGGVTECCHDLMAEALALLKAQEPVKPVRKQGLYLCGNCHETAVGYVADFTRRLIKLDNYCRKCGRAVKWND